MHKFKDLNEVFVIAAAAVLAIVFWGLISLESLSNFALSANNWVGETFDTFYIAIMNGSMLVLLLFLHPRFKNVLESGDSCRPAYSLVSWLAMLFTAGIGIGLLYYGMAEPLSHSLQPPNNLEASSLAAHKFGVGITMLHYGVQVWALYSIVGLGLLFYHTQYDLPYRISSLLYPILGERVHGFLGSLVDIMSIVAILFGVATTLGLGVEQINGGLTYIWGIPMAAGIQICLITVITITATISVVTGLDKGIRLLSLATASLSLILLAFIAGQNAMDELVLSIFEGGAYYVTNFLSLSLSMETIANKDWQKNWTTFYWAWWIAWSPFVGMFIARISKGRSLRQYICGTMLIPALFCGIWIMVFSHTAASVAAADGGKLIESIRNNFSVSFFTFLQGLPLSKAASISTLMLLVGFFVTSSDSGSLVVHMLAAKGNPKPAAWQRVFWSLLEGALAATLLMAGGLKALQAGSMLSTVPFGFVIIGLLISLPMKFIKATRGASTHTGSKDD